MTRIPSVLGTDDFALAELCAARIDGDLSCLHGAFVPIDEPDLPSIRAEALALGIDRALILDRRSAAWVHGAVPAPPQDTQCCRSAAARGTTDPRARGVREVILTPVELIEFGDVRCTSRARTAFDLLRDPSEPSDEVERIVGRLIETDDDLDRDVRARLHASERLPYRTLALNRLDRALSRLD
jgi:hypothetical protein